MFMACLRKSGGVFSRLPTAMNEIMPYIRAVAFLDGNGESHACEDKDLTFTKSKPSFPPHFCDDCAPCQQQGSPPLLERDWGRLWQLCDALSQHTH